MNDLYNKMINAAEKYNNTGDMLKTIFKLDSNEHYDCIVVAPSWVPEKILKRYDYELTFLTKQAYLSSYLVKCNGYKIAWIQCGKGASNLVDTVLTLGKCKCDKIVFVGAVGALTEDIKLGDIVTPKYSLAYEGGSLYTYEELDVKNFGKKIFPNKYDFISQVHSICKENNIEMKERVVYCTDSIICEYIHLDKIKALGSELIEMETASFYRCMELINKRGIALLCVSDNSATNISLVARTEEESKLFYQAREINIPKIIFDICEL